MSRDTSSTVASDTLAIANIDEQLMQFEAGLYATKWWDYQMLHPTEATYLYAEAYLLAARSYYARNVDVHRGQYMKPWKGKDPIENTAPQVAASLWKGRQMADSLGIPYSFYCFAAIEFAEVQKIWRSAPRPNQMYSAKRYETGLEVRTMVEYIAEKWQEKARSEIVHSADPYFRIGADHDDNRIKKLHRLFVMRAIKTSRSPHMPLYFALYVNDVLIESEALEYLGEYAVSRAKSMR